MRYKADVVVTLKDGIRDPKGEAIATVLTRIGMDSEPKVNVGKFFSLTINADDDSKAKEKLEQICQDVLSNAVLESYTITGFDRV